MFFLWWTLFSDLFSCISLDHICSHASFLYQKPNALFCGPFSCAKLCGKHPTDSDYFVSTSHQMNRRKQRTKAPLSLSFDHRSKNRSGVVEVEVGVRVRPLSIGSMASPTPVCVRDRLGEVVGEIVSGIESALQLF